IITGHLYMLKSITPEHDSKLQQLISDLKDKFAHPINGDNKKVLVFTAFSDTAEYLYNNLAEAIKSKYGLNVALVTGDVEARSTLKLKEKLDFNKVLTLFSPVSKERTAIYPNLNEEIDVLIATDCISEGQNLQDCDWLVNYDIHWNPVRIIQRFGCIDRIGSRNTCIQLVNFWPNMELEEYINLEQRVSGRMVLLDISATGEENIIEQQSGNQMNDLEYRRNQLLKMQDSVIDLEDLSSGVAITDLTLTDFRIDLAEFNKLHPGKLDGLPMGAFAVATSNDVDIPPGVIFCLRAEDAAAEKAIDPSYPLAPHYLVHASDDGTVLLPYTQAKTTLDRLKRMALGRDLPDASACARFDRATKHGEDMRHAQKLLSASVASIVGKSEERAVASLFSPGGTHAMKGEFAGSNDFEVLAYMVILPGTGEEQTA
ncbi:MAG: SWF/SNF helicase family protein, partial [Pseudomonas sp.]|nr:SWF/SNF helicase family protein [Pseudomonas sp.]